MPSPIEKDFEEYARRCSELALEAATPESRRRLLKMAPEYMRAARLMRRTSESASLAALHPSREPFSERHRSTSPTQ